MHATEPNDMKKLLRPIALAVLTTLGVAVHAELAGTWALTSEGRQGTTRSVLTVEQAEDGYTGSITGRRGTREVSDLTVDGDSFSFTFMMRAPMGLIELTYNGTVSEDTLSGSMSTPMGDRPFSGTRE